MLNTLEKGGRDWHLAVRTMKTKLYSSNDLKVKLNSHNKETLRSW